MTVRLSSGGEPRCASRVIPIFCPTLCQRCAQTVGTTAGKMCQGSGRQSHLPKLLDSSQGLQVVAKAITSTDWFPVQPAQEFQQVQPV